MDIVEQQFFQGNMRTSFEYARQENIEANEHFLKLFKQHGFDSLPQIPTTFGKQSIEDVAEHYIEEQPVLKMRAIKDEKLFQDEIQALERNAKLGSNEEKASSFFAQGYLFLHAHHYDESVHCFRQAVKLEPGNGVYAGICGQTIFRLNISPFEALAYLEHALKLQPDNARWYWNRALVLMQLYKDLHKEEFLNSAIYEIQLAKEKCREEQLSLKQGIETTDQEVGQLIMAR